MNTTRVTTRACWIASSVSARVWPRPGAAGSCCAATRVTSGVTTCVTRTSATTIASAAKNHHAHDLADELDQNSHGDDRLDDARKTEQYAERQRGNAEKEQRDVRKVFRGMHAREDKKKIAVLGRGEGNARVAE